MANNIRRIGFNLILILIFVFVIFFFQFGALMNFFTHTRCRSCLLQSLDSDAIKTNFHSNIHASVFTSKMPKSISIQEPDNNKSLSLDIGNFKFNAKYRLYQSDGKPIIWQFWNKDEIPLYVRLLIEAMQCRNPEFKVIVVTDSTIYDYLPDYNVPKEIFNYLTPNHKSDFFRIAILRKYGGVYADVDTFVLDKLYPLYQLLEKYDIVTSSWGNHPIAMGAIGPVRANTTLFDKWYGNQYEKVHEKIKIKNLTSDSVLTLPKQYPFGWAEVTLGAFHGVQEEMDSNRTLYRGYKGETSVGQLVKKGLEQEAASLFSRVSSKILPLKWSPFLFLHHSKIKGQFTEVNEISQLMPTGNETTLFSAFVGCALLDCLPDFEHMIIDAKNSQTALGHLNLEQLTKALTQMDSDICSKIKSARKPDFRSDVDLLKV
jgi:hypothetical protein